MILITHAARKGDQAFPVFIFSYLKPLSAVGELSAEFIAIDNVVVGVHHLRNVKFVLYKIKTFLQILNNKNTFGWIGLSCDQCMIQ